jgi:hypothetical protein
VTFWIFATAITFSAFAAVTIVGSALVGLARRPLTHWLQRYTPASRAALLLRLRLLPGAAALLIAFGVALPIFAWFEPPHTDESLARTLVAGAAMGMLLVARGLWRGAAALVGTWRMERDWRIRGRRIELPASPLPVYAIAEPFPVVAVVGIRRPALFVAERVLLECSADEIDAMVRHECAHVGERDNLKRLLICICPALGARALDRAWKDAAEEAADAAAVHGRPADALELAQALIHVARLAPVPVAPLLASAFYRGGSIEERVRRLLASDELSGAPRRTMRALSWKMAVPVLGGLATAIVLVAPALHQAMESFVSLLP